MKKSAYFITLLAVAGCGSFPIAIMHNPKTGDTVKCEPAEYYRGYEPWAYQDQLDKCIHGYEGAGYKRMPDGSTPTK